MERKRQKLGRGKRMEEMKGNKKERDINELKKIKDCSKRNNRKRKRQDA
jgi:hypothetical protein